jgi:hypothetical protein
MRSNGGCATHEMAGGADRKQAIVACRERPFDRAPTAALESYVRSSRTDGPVAQLGARLNGIQEVTGSIPVRSTTPSPAGRISRK